MSGLVDEYSPLSLGQRCAAQRLLSIARRLRPHSDRNLQFDQPVSNHRSIDAPMKESEETISTFRTDRNLQVHPIILKEHTPIAVTMEESEETIRPNATAMEESGDLEIINPFHSIGNLHQCTTSTDLSKTQAFELLESLYRDHPGAVWRAASRRALEEPNFSRATGFVGKNLVYGEISFIALERLLSMCVEMQASLKNGITFYDLGCGSGRVVFAASLLHSSFVKSVGIEILPDMHHMNRELLRLYNAEIAPHLHEDKRQQQIEFVCGDFVKVNWSDADLVFMNATCFDDGLVQELERKASEALKQGSIVITVSKPFCNHAIWEPLEENERRMSWSSATVFVYRKRWPSSLKQPTSLPHAMLS